MSTKVYSVYVNNLRENTLIVTDRELSEINIKDVISNVETYKHYQDEYENDFYKINNKDVVSFNLLEVTEKVVVDTAEKVIGAKELKERYYNICFEVEFHSNECAKNYEVYEYFKAQMRAIESITNMDLSQIKEKAFQKAKNAFKSYMCY